MYAEIMTVNGFNNPWYWLLVSVVWVRAIQWTLGVPNHMMRAAIKGDDQAKQDAQALIDIHIRSSTFEFNHFGTVLVLLTCFVLASFATMGFLYDVAFLQGVFFIAMPMALLGAIGLRVAFRLHENPVNWAGLCTIYRHQRWLKVTLAIVFISATMMWALFLELRPYL